MSTFVRWMICALILTAVSLPAPTAGAEDVDQLFAQGTAALEAGKHEDALRAFEAVWKLRKTHDVAANLAQAELQLKRYRDAAEHLSFALESFPVTGKAAVRKQIEELLATAKGNVVTLRVRVSADKAEVKVNGKVAGTAPIARELFADPGPVTVEAALHDHETAKQTVVANKGETRDVELRLTAKVTPSALRSSVPALVMGGAAVVTAGIGIGFMAAWADGRAHVQEVSSDIRDKGNSCVVGAANFDPRCPSVDGDSRAVVPLSRAGVGFLIGATVLGAGAAAYWFWPRTHDARASARLLPFASPEGGGTVIVGSF